MKNVENNILDDYLQTLNLLTKNYAYKAMGFREQRRLKLANIIVFDIKEMSEGLSPIEGQLRKSLREDLMLPDDDMALEYLAFAEYWSLSNLVTSYLRWRCSNLESCSNSVFSRDANIDNLVDQLKIELTSNQTTLPLDKKEAVDLLFKIEMREIGSPSDKILKIRKELLLDIKREDYPRRLIFTLRWNGSEQLQRYLSFIMSGIRQEDERGK